MKNNSKYFSSKMNPKLKIKIFSMGIFIFYIFWGLKNAVCGENVIL
jgi:hypothetical protein